MSPSKQGQPTILVTDANLGSAISVIRSLGRRGWRVVAADSLPNSLGFRSRYTHERLLYPAPQTAPGEFVALLLQTVRSRRVDVVIPATDATILPLLESRDEFDEVCRLAMPETAGLKVVMDKFETLELARRCGVPTPQTCLVHTVQEACEAGPALGWPIVLKPQVSRLYRNGAGIEFFTVCYAEDSERLVEQMQRFEGRCPVLLQEYYPGVGYGVELLSYQGRPLAAFQHKRLHEVPITGGASSFREGVALDPVLYEHSIRMLEVLGWTGLAMVEFKIGENGARLMEINGRIWGSLPLAVLSGVDFPARLAELYLYGPPDREAKPQLSYRVGVRARSLELDLLWMALVLSGRRRYPFLAAPSRREGLTALLGLLKPTYKFDIQSLEDPLPGLADIPKIVRKFSQKRKSF